MYHDHKCFSHIVRFSNKAKRVSSAETCPIHCGIVACHCQMATMVIWKSAAAQNMGPSSYSCRRLIPIENAKSHTFPPLKQI